MVSVAQECKKAYPDFVRDRVMVHVTWRDAHFHENDWVEVDSLEMPDAIINSCGFMVKEDEHLVMLALSLSNDKAMASGMFTITKGQIVSVRRLEE